MSNLSGRAPNLFVRAVINDVGTCLPLIKDRGVEGVFFPRSSR